MLPTYRGSSNILSLRPAIFFFLKSQIINVLLNVVGHLVSFVTTQLCLCSIEAAIDNM